MGLFVPDVYKKCKHCGGRLLLEVPGLYDQEGDWFCWSCSRRESLSGQNYPIVSTKRLHGSTKY